MIQLTAAVNISDLLDPFQKVLGVMRLFKLGSTFQVII